MHLQKDLCTRVYSLGICLIKWGRGKYTLTAAGKAFSFIFHSSNGNVLGRGACSNWSWPETGSWQATAHHLTKETRIKNRNPQDHGAVSAAQVSSQTTPQKTHMRPGTQCHLVVPECAESMASDLRVIITITSVVVRTTHPPATTYPPCVLQSKEETQGEVPAAESQLLCHGREVPGMQ